MSDAAWILARVEALETEVKNLRAERDRLVAAVELRHDASRRPRPPAVDQAWWIVVFVLGLTGACTRSMLASSAVQTEADRAAGQL
jgi:hypothetical protein